MTFEDALQGHRTAEATKSTGSIFYQRTNAVLIELDEAVRLLQLMADDIWGAPPDDVVAFLEKHKGVPYGRT